MFNRALAVGVLALAALPLCAQSPVPVATRTGASTGATGAAGVTSYAVSWTQTSANYNPTVNLTVQSSNGSAATATVYLTNKLGAGTTAAANQIATGTITVSATTPTSTAVAWSTGTPILLPGATYYVVVTSMSANFQWAFVNNGATETPISGTTYNNDQVDFAAPSGYAPASTSFGLATAGTSSHILLYSVTAIPGTPSSGPGPTGVPTLGTMGMIGAGTLLAFSGLIFLKRQPVNPLR